MVRGRWQVERVQGSAFFILKSTLHTNFQPPVYSLKPMWWAVGKKAPLGKTAVATNATNL
jgi:hypothetical protein